MKRTLRLLATVSLTLLPMVRAACDPPPKASPVPDRVALAGDSVLWQGYLYGGDLRGADTSMVYPGTTAEDFVDEAQTMVADPARSPYVLVIAFGQNNRNNYGSAERSALMRLSYAPQASACVVFVLPHDGLNSADIRQVRTDMIALYESRPNSVVVDWSPVAPPHLATDHVHLDVPEYNSWVDDGAVPDPDAVAYLDLINSGVDQCG